MGAAVVLAEIVAVVGRDQRNAGFARERGEAGVDLLLLLQALVLQLKKEVALAENLLIFLGGRQRFFFFAAAFAGFFADLAGMIGSSTKFSRPPPRWIVVLPP